LVNRQFVASDINQLWVTDMTSELVIAALNMALLTRKPQGVIHHSDQGS
jgi:transposase InsO family protein